MYAAIVKKQKRTDQAGGVIAAQLSAVLGVVMGVIGTWGQISLLLLFLFRRRHDSPSAFVVSFAGAKMAIEK